MTEKLKDMESSPRSPYIHLMSTVERKNRPTGNPKRISQAEEKQELQIERVFPVTSPKRRKPLTYNEKRNKSAPLFTWKCHPFNGNTRATREGGNIFVVVEMKPFDSSPSWIELPFPSSLPDCCGGLELRQALLSYRLRDLPKEASLGHSPWREFYFLQRVVLFST